MKRKYKRGENLKAILNQDDIVILNSISVTDNWHNQRHALLHKEYKVVDAGNATPHEGFPYTQWYGARLIPVVPFPRNALALYGMNSILFARCKLVKVKESNNILPARMTVREIMLDKINSEISCNDLLSRRPKDEFDKKEWQHLFEINFDIEASFANENFWHDAGSGSFKWSDGRVKFKFKGKRQGDLSCLR